MKVVLLAGGRGTRISEETSIRPKPMVEIGGVPMLEHIMRHYAGYGSNEFVVACGYLGNVIKEHFAHRRSRVADFTVDLATGSIDYHSAGPEEWVVTLVDTGLDTMTGGRLARLREYVGDDTFMMTYGDGLSDVDLDALVARHRAEGRYATITAVRPPARFGSLVLDGAEVSSFEEKISTGEALINGGFFVLEPEVFDYLVDDATPFERAPLERLVSDGQLTAYVHDGFWKAMDTLRDKMELEAMWAEGNAPWAPR